MTNAPSIRPLAACVLLLAASSCRITINTTDEDARWKAYDVSPLGVTVATVEGEDGAVTTYTVSGQSLDFPVDVDEPKAAVVATTVAVTDEPHLGVSVRALDVASANALRLEPWSGVYVSKVEEGAAAEAAGVAGGDVIIAMGGVDVTSPEQFEEVVQLQLAVGEVVRVDLLREGTDRLWHPSAIDLTVGAESVEATDSARDEFVLDVPLIRATGMGVFDPGPELHARIYGADARPAPVVAAVVVGSPAYLAGVRAGDRVLVAAGQQVSSVDDLRARVQGLGTRSPRLPLELDGPLGPHGASFDVLPDVLERSDFHIPVLVDYEKRPRRRSLSVLDFIFQFGFSKRTRYAVSETREPSKSSRLSILPLGMFEFSRTDTQAKNRIFWLITWSSRR